MMVVMAVMVADLHLISTIRKNTVHVNNVSEKTNSMRYIVGFCADSSG